MHQSNFIPQIKFQKFSKYDFVESFISVAKDGKIKEEEKEKIQAAMIADAIEVAQAGSLENLATKEDIKSLEKDIKSLEKDIKSLEDRMTIKLTVIMAGLFTFLPLATDFFRHLFKF